MYSESWFNSLPEDLQQIMMDAGKLWIENERQGIADMEEEWLNEIKEYGTNIITLTDEQLDALQQATASVYDLYRQDYGTEILDQIIAAVS